MKKIIFASYLLFIVKSLAFGQQTVKGKVVD